MTLDGLDNFCGGPAWSYNLTWNTTNPDFTPCFLLTLMVWIPCSLLWILTPLELYLQKTSASKIMPWTGTNVTRMVIAAGLVVLCFADMMDCCFNRRLDKMFSAIIVADVLMMATYVLSIILMARNKKKGRHTSGTLFIFFFCQTVCQIFSYRSSLLQLREENRVPDESAFVFQMISFPLLVAELVLCCVADSYKRPFRGISGVPYGNIECPEQYASYASKLVFWWFNKMAILGWRKPLTVDDLWQLNHKDRAEYVSAKFDRNWPHTCLGSSELSRIGSDSINGAKSKEISLYDIEYVSDAKRNKESKQVNIAWSLTKTFWLYFCVGSIGKLIYDLLLFANPLLLKLLISHVQSSEPTWKGILYAILLFVNGCVQSLLLGNYFHRMFTLGMRVRTALTSAIYRKSLTLSSASRRESTMGEIVNLMSVDSQRFMDLMAYINMVWSAPLQIVLALVLLWQILGASVLAGVLTMVVILPLNALIASKTKTLQAVQMQKKDERVKLINEVLSGIKVLKLYAWEEAFKLKVLDIRDKEVQQLRRIAYLNTFGMFIWTCSPVLVSLATFATYVLVDERHILDATTAFVSLSLFNILRFPLTMLPNLITSMVMANVSVKRINKYLSSEELEDYVIKGISDVHPVIIQNGDFTWPKTEETEVQTLQNINLSVDKGSLIAVVGQVGSGKSSLLSAILGDMEKLGGLVSICGSTALVSQQPWIQNASLKENILFSLPFHKESYREVLDACGLLPDLAVLPGGDETEIGEKGINLSGGQKQRVSLARAVYASADIYLLDDPLSAVDSHVGRHIFDRVIGGNGLLRNKTRLLVTHGVTYLPQTDLIVVMKEGRIAELGSFQQLVDKKGPFSEFLSQYFQEADATEQDQEILEDIGQKNPELLRSISEMSSESECPSDGEVRRRSMLSINHPRRSSSIKDRDTPTKQDKYKAVSSDKVKLIQTEVAETGQVKFSVYLNYLKAVGLSWVLLILIGNVAWQAFQVASNFWLGHWGDEKPGPNGTQVAATRDLFLGVYGALGIAQSLAVYVGSFGCAYGALLAANRLHEGILGNVLRSPMSFFDTTPLGRIVNRFAKDIDTLDITIPMTIRSWLSCFLQVVATLVVISIQTPIFLAVVLPIGIVYYVIQRFYVSTSRQLKRLESITRSPVYSHFSETLAGCSTIRAYGAQERFWKHSNDLVDRNQVCYYPNIVANRWLAIRLDFCGSCIILFSALFAVLGKDHLNPGEVGLSVSYALMITQTLNWMVRMTSELETNIVAVERVLEYTYSPTEAAWVIEDAKLPDSWPNTGVVQFDKYSTRYREGLDLVLKQISCTFAPGQKVGIVGRTGAGKSSLTLALFRLIEATGGTIFIDEVKIADIGLHQLRSRITIIPQDPVLFSGSLQLNLDPFSLYTEEQLWQALEHAHLKSFIQSLPQGLSHEVVEGGENLSVGQRQLVCLARALLRKTKILVLDEATAAIDLETDDLIQTTIRREFSDCTVLTIAHRLNTIMDYDRIIVLDNGRIAEFESPDALLKDKKTIFYGMAKDAGLV